MTAQATEPTTRRALRAIDVLFWVAVTAAVVANLFVLVPAFTTVRLWEDEAFNLTVPLNLLRGLGYTSDGTLSGSELTPFDVRISTGPVVLLPIAALMALGIDPVIAGRSVALVGYGALLSCLWLLGRRLGGRWAALAAAALPLAYATDALPSPIQTPVDILGEVSAAALLAAALLVLHRRPWLAGLLLGLAVQAKFIALLAVPAFAIAGILDAPGPGFGQRLRATWRRVLAAAVCAAAPTVAVELWKLLALGPAGYVENLRFQARFLLSGGQAGYRVSPVEKIGAFLDAWHLPWWLVATVALLGVVLAVIGIVAVRREPSALSTIGLARVEGREFTVTAGAAAVGLVTYLAWGLGSSHTPGWLRHPAPGVLAFLPVVVASVIALARVALGSRGAPRPAPWRVSAVVLGLAGMALLAVSLVGRIMTPSYGTWETLDQQRAAARDIAELGHDRLASTWDAPVSVIVLSGAHAGLVDAGAAVADDAQVWLAVAPPECELLLSTGAYLLCAPPGGRGAGARVDAVPRGPRSTTHPTAAPATAPTTLSARSSADARWSAEIHDGAASTSTAMPTARSVASHASRRPAATTARMPSGANNTACEAYSTSS
ncbi:hypothetical protein [Agromyces sp. Marseille-P2726]|uniref:hypothetical protein n=1 Tax=Agromyces sp. Marseille-P2726 TaxID=2709132 RepID=UPI00156ED8E9|nr:hypothetical protein [Agromyces sp. Marseille-P2726]